ncbi:MAG: thioredoxin domain-containing protein [Candidatus Paceibacterota bacterium]|jgi:protein-disulfide isomerase
MNPESPRSSSLNIPGAIIIAGAIVAIAIIWAKKPVTTVPVTDTTDNQVQETVINLAPVTASDHILGNPNSAIKIVEYSDPSCGYCKLFNPTMISIIEQYGPSGKVSWVYRSFPLDKPDANGNVLHPNAGNESQALECVASIGGNDKFWAYEKSLYTQDTTGTSGLNQKQLPIMAKEIGIDLTAFNKCLNNGQFKDKIDADSLSGINAGVSGTPTSFFVLKEPLSPSADKYISDALIKYRIPTELIRVADDKKIVVMSGALPKALISGLIDVILGN